MGTKQPLGGSLISYVSGDLFYAKTDAIVQGCNTLGIMGRGIAAQFRTYYPDMFTDYKKRCDRKDFPVGSGYMYVNEKKPHIINLATQQAEVATLQYVNDSFAWLANSYKSLGLESVAMPRIGSGLGGLKWEQVEQKLYDNFKGKDLKIQVWGNR